MALALSFDNVAMGSVHVGNVEINLGVLISLAVVEVSLTLLKSFLFDRKCKRVGILCFVTESCIGIILTSITSASLFSRTVAWKQYPIVTSVALVLIEISIILLEAKIIWYMISKENEDRRRSFEHNSGFVAFIGSITGLSALAAISFAFPMLFLVIIAIKRRTLELSSDRPVEITTAISLLYILTYIFIFMLHTNFNLKRFQNPENDSEDIQTYVVHDEDPQINSASTNETSACEADEDIETPFIKAIYSPLGFSYCISIAFTCMVLLATLIETFRRNKYIDSGTVTIFMVVGPGSFSVSALAFKVPHSKPDSVRIDFKLDEVGLEVGRNG